MGQNENSVNRKDHVQFWLIMAASCLLLIAFVVPTRIVEANAVLARPAATAPPPAPVKTPTPLVAAQKAPIKLMRGFASWYGGVFNGRQTASGETFDQNEMTACHPTLPFGTRVKVENTRNHKSVIVRITDRGLLYGRRVIDLSYAAAEKIGMTEVGVVPVTIQVLSKTETN
jgi:rare lipoprotein A